MLESLKNLPLWGKIIFGMTLLGFSFFLSIVGVVFYYAQNPALSAPQYQVKSKGFQGVSLENIENLTNYYKFTHNTITSGSILSIGQTEKTLNGKPVLHQIQVRSDGKTVKSISFQYARCNCNEDNMAWSYVKQVMEELKLSNVLQRKVELYFVSEENKIDLTDVVHIKTSEYITKSGTHYSKIIFEAVE